MDRVAQPDAPLVPPTPPAWLRRLSVGVALAAAACAGPAHTAEPEPEPTAQAPDDGSSEDEAADPPADPGVSGSEAPVDAEARGRAELAHAEGMAAQRDGRTQAALAFYDRCLELDPTFAACHWERGWSLWTLADWEGVVEAWQAVKGLDPDHDHLDEWLPRAQDNLADQQRLEALAASAPDSVRPPLPEGRTLRLRAVGDIMLGTDFPAGHLPPDDGATLLQPVRSLLTDADLTFGNLEGPLCDGGETRKCKGSDPSRCYAFRTPTRYGRYLADAGFDVMSTANNHSGDFGETCRRQTEDTLDALGIAWSGPPGSIATVDRAGFRVGLVAFHTSPSCNYINDHEGAATLVRAAQATHDLVVVSFHGGAEGSKATHVPRGMETFYGEKRGHLRAFARAVVEAGADLVLGHGPHVPRGMEVVDGRLVAYSLGNFATYGRFSLSGHLGTSLVLEVELDHEGRFLAGRILPVRQVGRGLPQPDDERRTAIGLIRSLSMEDFPDTAPQIGADGSVAPR